MKFRLATLSDLENIKNTFNSIIIEMEKGPLQIWDDEYPSGTFETDIRNNSLYVLIDKDSVVSSFTLEKESVGAKYLEWENNEAKALYMVRLGVHPSYTHQGIGSYMIKQAIRIAKEENFEYLRLFSVYNNIPATNLYEKNGFTKAIGIYDDVVDVDIVYREFGFEIKV